jgi:hypothetical protein
MTDRIIQKIVTANSVKPGVSEEYSVLNSTVVKGPFLA